MTPSVQLKQQKEAGEYPVMLDDSQMKRVFDNLVENSRKYAAVEEIRVTISMSREDGDVVPGVSGGTIAFILGFYDRFIGSINDVAFFAGMIAICAMFLPGISGSTLL